ncbi:uncharacterized protein LOC141641066 [Silene latifolia]|uniref:uncharacterized protein LOC141641066 n=1 Tax=Silene latifolia TaxID=37657 RepID=UPI003D7707AB
MVNSDWLALYPEAYAHFFPEGLFYHNPSVCFRRSSRARRRTPFRYYNMWSLAPDFKEVVQGAWNQTVNGTLMFQLVTKLKKLKSSLKVLNRNCFSDVEKSVGVAKALLDDIQIQMHHNPTDYTILASESEAAESYRHLCRIKHNFLSQKAKVGWIKFGDENTRFFHNQIRARQVHNRVMC